jgi:hypothetical protein
MERAPERLAAQARVVIRRYGARLNKDAVGPMGEEMGNSGIASAQEGWLAQSNQHVVVRRPKDLEQALIAHNTVFILAYQAGHPEIVLPAGVDSGGTRMVLPHAGTSFVTGLDATEEELKAVPEATRVTSALIDFLTVQHDRFPKNVLVHIAPEGGGAIAPTAPRDSTKSPVILIDHDGSLAPQGLAQSEFFPRKSLGFTSPQTSVDNLPPRAR